MIFRDSILFKFLLYFFLLSIMALYLSTCIYFQDLGIVNFTGLGQLEQHYSGYKFIP